MKAIRLISSHTLRTEGEAECRQCGRCCRRKVEGADGKVIAWKNYHCEYLDEDTMLCLVYSWRFSAPKDETPCQTLKQCIAKGLLPMDCPYVKNDTNYKCAVDVWE